MNLSAFGWLSSQSASVQRAALQSALDSGEPIEWIGTVLVDAPLLLRYCPSLTGYGGDVTCGATAASQLRCAEPNVDVLLLTKSNAILADFNVHGDGQRMNGTGRGIVIGEGCTDHVRGVTLDRVTVNSFHRLGMHFVATAGTVLDRCNVLGRQAAIQVENVLDADCGDNFISNCTLGADPTQGACLRWYSGGGLYLTSVKMLQSFNHIRVDCQGSSGNLSVTGGSLESCSQISVLMTGSVPFTRMQFTGVTWGVSSACLVVGNASPMQWLDNLNVSGCTLSGGADGSPLIDLGHVRHAVIMGNELNGNGLASCGVMVRAECTDSRIGPNGIWGCGTPVVSFSPSVVVTP